MSKHIPGPWAHNGASFSMDGPDQGYMSIDVEDERGARIALVQGRTEKQLMANAALISAAPELMRELVGVLEEWEEGECDEVVLVESRIKRIKAAIAKAEGRTK